MDPIDDESGRRPKGLTSFQIEVTREFFAQPASAGFLLAGGAALLAQHLTDRPTQDLDFFTSRGNGEVTVAVAGLETAATRRGWTVQHIRDSETFVRLVITGPEDLLVDLAMDSPPGRPPTVSFLGPTFDPEELAGRKVIALFDRAEARDFADVYALATRFGKPLLLARAAEIDPGFDSRIFADMLRSLDRFADTDIPTGDIQPSAVRTFFTTWADELT